MGSDEGAPPDQGSRRKRDRALVTGLAWTGGMRWFSQALSWLSTIVVRTDPHHHARCVVCGRVMDLVGDISPGQIDALRGEASGFTVTGYRLELSGYCSDCLPQGSPPP